MPIPEHIAAIRADPTKTEKQKREDVYYVKCKALLGVIQPMRGQAVEHKGFTFCINKVEITQAQSLKLDVTFTRPPSNPVTHQINIVNPPLLPRSRTGNEKEDMVTAVSEMLEGFV